MAKVTNIINAIDPNTKEYDIFLQDILSRNNDLPSDNDELNNLQSAIISHVNSRLNQSTTRHEGINTLIHVLPRCSKEILAKHGIFWITKASQTLENSQSSTKEINLACKFLGNLVTLCKDITELQKHVSMQCVKQLIVTISNLPSEKQCGATFYLIATLLYHYREPSERLQTSIRKMILPLVDSDQKHLAQAGANCYTLLARATERSFKAPNAKPNYTGWIYSQALLCNSLNAIMDDLFSGLIELDGIDIWDKLELPDISEDNVIEYYCSIERRFGNLCIYLATMLKGCGGKNAVSPSEILQVLCRGLAVTSSSLRNDDSFKSQMLHFILPKLQISLILVLNAFIEGFQQELMPFAVTILQLYQQTLKWTENIGENQSTISGSKPFKNVRIAVYKSISLWLSCVGTLSGIEIFSEEFLPHILKDITPEKERVLLTVQKNHHLSKRALKRFKDNQYESSTSLGSANVAKKNPRLNTDLCMESLKMLENIFFNAGGTLKQSFYKVIQNVVVPHLYDYYLGKINDNYYEHDDECRLHLLKVLKAIHLNPHPSTPPPTQYSIQVFGMALRDKNLTIIEESKAAIAELEKISHPSAPTLELPLRNIDDIGERQLGIHWSRPPVENTEESGSNIENQTDNSVWDRFREAQREKATADQIKETKKELLEVANEDQVACAVINEELAETAIDGPTPSKQQKLAEQDASEKMDTSEDDLIATTPQKNETSSNSDDSTTTEFEIPSKKIDEQVSHPVTPDNADESVAEHENSSYLTLKEIQGNNSQLRRRMEIEIEITTSYNVDRAFISNDSIPNAQKERVTVEDIADRSNRDVQRCLDDNSDDEAILSLFCDELKDS